MKHICRIGNNAQNDLVIIDRTAADFHAHLTMDHEGRIWINDLSSKYGTRVNGEKVSNVELSYYDEVRIGFTIIDWLGIRNKWLDDSVVHVNSSAWSAPLKQEESLLSQVSQELANEAIKQNQEYNPIELESKLKETEIVNSLEVGHTNQTENIALLTIAPILEIPASSNELNLDSESAKIDSNISTANEIHDISTENNEMSAQHQDLEEVEEIDKNSAIIESTENVEITEPESSVPVIEQEIHVEQSIISNVMEENVVQENRQQKKGKGDILKPIVIATSTGIRFDYRTSAHSAETSSEESTVKVVAKTSVPNYEPVEPKPFLSKEIKLVLAVIALVLAMLLAGWLFAALGRN